MQARKDFVDKVATLIGEYIADISVYFYANRSMERLNEESKDIVKQIKEIDSKLEKYHSEIEKNSQNTKLFISNLIIIEKFNIEKSSLLLRKDDKDKEIERTRKERTIANKCYFTIKIYLKDIPCAVDLLEQLKNVHSISVSAYNQDLNAIEIEAEKLINLAVKFGDDYTKLV